MKIRWSRQRSTQSSGPLLSAAADTRSHTQRQVTQLQKTSGRPPRQRLFVLRLHSRRDFTLVGRCIHSLLLHKQSNDPDNKNTHMAAVSVSASCCCFFLRRCERLWQEGALEPQQEKTQDLHTELYSMNQVWSQWPTNPMDYMRYKIHNCFLSTYLFIQGLSSGQMITQTLWNMTDLPLFVWIVSDFSATALTTCIY